MPDFSIYRSNNNTIHFCDFHRLTVEYGRCCLTIVYKNIPLLDTHLYDSHLQCSVTVCNIDRYGSNHLHKLAKGPSSNTLGTGSGQADGRDIPGVTSWALITLSLVRGRNYGVVCGCSAVPTLVREGGVGLSF